MGLIPRAPSSLRPTPPSGSGGDLRSLPEVVEQGVDEENEEAENDSSRKEMTHQDRTPFTVLMPDESDNFLIQRGRTA
jgi:hypothetical protein